MSFVELTGVSSASVPNPSSGDVRFYMNTTGLGPNAAACLSARDSTGAEIKLGQFSTLDYRLINIRILTSGTSYVPTAGTRAAYVECIGPGAQGGGAATSSSTVSMGGGGGGGAYAASWITGAALKNPTTYAIGAGGTGASAGNAGNNGGDTTWDTNVIVAKGGLGGPVMAAGSTNIVIAGGAGGALGSCVGDFKMGGKNGFRGIRLSGTTYLFAGDGAHGILGGDGGLAAVNSAAGAAGANGVDYGTGGAGAATLATAQVGGNGIQGVIRVWEFG